MAVHAVQRVGEARTKVRKVDPISLAVGDESANPRFVFGSDDGYDGLAELDRPRNLLSTHLPGEVRSRLRASDDSDERLAVAHPGAHCRHVTLIHLDVEPRGLQERRGDPMVTVISISDDEVSLHIQEELDIRF